MKLHNSFHILFFDGVQHVGKPIDFQIKKAFPEHEVQIISLTKEEIEPTQHLDNILVLGYSLGARRALDWVKETSFKGPVFLLDPECWKPSLVYVWATQNRCGKKVFSLVVKYPLVLNSLLWALPNKMKKQAHFFVKNRAFRNQLYQDWQASSQYRVVSLESLGAQKSQLTVVTSGEKFFLKYIPVEKIKRLGINIETITESSHTQLWKHFLEGFINPNESFQ
jgi:hypothetical protein